MRYNTFVSRVINFLKVLIGILMVLSLALLFINIVLREFTSFSFAWVENTTIYLIMWIVFLGVGLVFWDDEHISMDFLYEKLSESMQKKLNFIIHFLVIITAVLLLVFGSIVTNQLYEFKQMSANGNIPLFLIMLSIPFGSMICIFSILSRLILDNKRK